MNQGFFFFKCVVMWVAGLLLFGFVTMLLWNWLIPVLFNGPELTYVQALGLLALSKLLTIGFWGRQMYRPHSSHSFWKHKLQEKLSSLDPQEREAIKQKLKDKWCRWEQETQSGKTPNS